ncbi:MAG: preprotein translocase subunit YajC [Candidatus Omnitrophica bacterium]|nr:preprotein translocase subunit YajC [Candidatus Omnitrophota bacterium]
MRLWLLWAEVVPDAPRAPNPLVSLFPLVMIFGIFYVLMLRPQQKAQKQHAAMLQALKKNDEVVTSGGVHGTVLNVKEETVTVRIDDNVKMDVDKSAISRVKKQRGEGAASHA